MVGDRTLYADGTIGSNPTADWARYYTIWLRYDGVFEVEEVSRYKFEMRTPGTERSCTVSQRGNSA